MIVRERKNKITLKELMGNKYTQEELNEMLENFDRRENLEKEMRLNIKQDVKNAFDINCNMNKYYFIDNIKIIGD